MGGIEDLAVKTIAKLDDGSVWFAISIVLLVLVIYREKYWTKQVAESKAEVLRCHEAHDKTRTALLEEVRSGGQTLVLVRETLKTMNTTVDVLSRSVSEFINSRKGGNSR